LHDASLVSFRRLFGRLLRVDDVLAEHSGLLSDRLGRCYDAPGSE